MLPELIKSFGLGIADELLVVVLCDYLHLEAALPREVLIVLVVQFGKQIFVLAGAVQPEHLLYLKTASRDLLAWLLLHWF